MAEYEYYSDESEGEVFGFNSDSDLCESADEDKRQKGRKGIESRVDEYLTASRLGRLAFVAGDVQLAKDRFNLAMDLEFLTEMESNGDFGVTGGKLREELSSRTETANDAAEGGDEEKLAKLLAKLQHIFVKADEKAAFNTADTQSFLLMGAALSMVGEWDKAELVYREGVAASPNGKTHQLKDALKRLNKLRDTIKLFGGEKTTKSKKIKTPTLPRSRKVKRPNSQLLFYDDSKLGRSRSYSSDLSGSDCSDTEVACSPMKEPVPLSPLVVATCSPKQKRKHGGFHKLFKRPKSVLIGNNGMSPSSSAEDIRGLGTWRERSTWKSVFDFDHVKQSLEEFNSRTVQTMRAMNHVTSLKDHQQSIQKDFKW